METINWGILGTGYIAQEFAQALNSIPEAKLLAVASRGLGTGKQRDKAYSFARRFRVPRHYNSYEALAADKEIDIVYIATPNTAHKENCLLCLTAGKAVLCEKPFTLNAQEAKEVIELAREKNLFCMEAMWTRFLPVIQHARQLLRDNLIGEIKMLTASFGIIVPPQPLERHYNPQLGGGALLDIGIYPISLAHYFLGPPTGLISQGIMGNTQVDEQSSLVFHYDNGALATLSSSFLTQLANEIIIAGTQGEIKIHAPIYRPEQLTLTPFSQPKPATHTSSNLAFLKKIKWLKKAYHVFTRLKQESRTLTLTYQGNGYHYQAIEAMNCLRLGKIESHIMPLDETLAIMQTLDNIRSQWQFKYPNEV